MHYPLTVAAIFAALVVYVFAMMKVGKARAQFGVPAPAISGSADFERVFRAHQNTVEQLVMFLPLVVLTGMIWGDLAGGVYGGIWAIGRLLYVVTYAKAADKRGLGFMLSGGLSMLVLIGLIVTLGLGHFGITIT